MSRIGKKPIKIEDGVNIEITSKKVKAVCGNKELEIKIPNEVSIAQKGNEIIVTRKNESCSARSIHGLTARMIQNIIRGVKNDFSKELIFTGTGYRVSIDGSFVKLNMGYSHEVSLEIPEGLGVTVKKNSIFVTGADKQKVGELAANIREVRSPEVYKGKGIRYSNEIIRRKAGKKTAA